MVPVGNNVMEARTNCQPGENAEMFNEDPGCWARLRSCLWTQIHSQTCHFERSATNIFPVRGPWARSRKIPRITPTMLIRGVLPMHCPLIFYFSVVTLVNCLLARIQHVSGKSGPRTLVGSHLGGGKGSANKVGENSLNLHLCDRHSRDFSTPRPSVSYKK